MRKILFWLCAFGFIMITSCKDRTGLASLNGSPKAEVTQTRCLQRCKNIEEGIRLFFKTISEKSGDCQGQFKVECEDGCNRDPIEQKKIEGSCYTDFMIHFSGDDESLTDRCCVGKRRIGDLEKTWSMEIFGIFKKMDCKGGVLGITVCRWDKLA